MSGNSACFDLSCWTCRAGDWVCDWWSTTCAEASKARLEQRFTGFGGQGESRPCRRLFHLERNAFFAGCDDGLFCHSCIRCDLGRTKVEEQPVADLGCSRLCFFSLCHNLVLSGFSAKRWTTRTCYPKSACLRIDILYTVYIYIPRTHLTSVLIGSWTLF